MYICPSIVTSSTCVPCLADRDSLSTSTIEPDEGESSLLYAMDGLYRWTHSFMMVKIASQTALTDVCTRGKDHPPLALLGGPASNDKNSPHFLLFATFTTYYYG